jgi:hypothetical protein
MIMRAALFGLILSVGANAEAATTSYGVQANFQSAVTNSFKLINLDAAPYSSNPSGYRLSDVASSLLSDGLVSVGYNATVLAGQNGQTPTNRDWLITNGSTFSGGQPAHIAFNFVGSVNGVGAYSNILGNSDGGRVRIFSGANLGGTLLGEVSFGLGASPDGFGGIVSTTAIGSVEVTCDFNADMACGVYDLQFGALANAVPEGPTWALMIAGFGLAGISLRRRHAGVALA